MKTMQFFVNLFLVSVFSLPMLTAQDNDKVLLTISEITVKQGNNTQFIEGVKKWKECYLENNGKEKWNFWRRLQGEGTVYVLAGVMNNWAEMDQEDPVDKECRTTILNFIMPHVEKIHFDIAQTMPEVSRAFSDDTKLVWNTFFKVKNEADFMEIINNVSSAIKAKEGSYRATWFNYMGGGPETPHYMVSTPYKGFSGLDVERDSPAKIYENAVGKKKGDEMLATWRNAVDDSWSYVYTLNSELSN